MSTATANYQTDRSATSALDALGAGLARNWWLIALRGALGVAFGLIALIMPVATILALVLLFSAYMLVDGVLAIYAAVRAARQRESWGLLVFQGIASLIAGVIAFLWPGITVLAFVLLIAAWSIVTGCLMLAAAFHTEAARWWLVLGGAAAVLFGILMIVAPFRSGRAYLVAWRLCSRVCRRANHLVVQIAISVSGSSESSGGLIGNTMFTAHSGGNSRLRGASRGGGRTCRMPCRPNTRLTRA
jgi:uncharacterized membrane protein HdeD (DUF308 family)